MSATAIFLVGAAIVIIGYDIFAYVKHGLPATISSEIYALVHLPIAGPIVSFLTGALLYHLFICPAGCG